MSERNQNSWVREAIIKGFKKNLKKKISVFLYLMAIYVLTLNYMPEVLS